MTIALEDLLEARELAQYIINQSLHAAATSGNSLCLRAFSEALVIAYARAFLESKTEGSHPTAARIGDKLLRPLDTESRDLHDLVIALRNEAVAHSDARMHSVKFAIKSPAKEPAGRISVGKKRDARRPLTREQVEQLAAIIEHLIGAVIAERQALTSTMPNMECL